MENEPERRLGVGARMKLGFAIAGAIVVLSVAGATVGVGMVQVQHIANVVHDFGHTEPFIRGTITAPPPGKPQTLLLARLRPPLHARRARRRRARTRSC